MRVIPGTHLVGQLPHKETHAQDNLLSRGQDIEVSVDEKQAVDVELRPGQISLHHTMIVHGSEPNRSDTRRLGIPIRYVAARVRQTTGVRGSATLVRGTDNYGNFVAEPRPRWDFDPVAAQFRDEVVAAYRRQQAELSGAQVR
jgi:ectoine hydroxylase-related dioxygenase (phytanoyl-CoA dioxygenase family)